MKLSLISWGTPSKVKTGCLVMPSILLRFRVMHCVPSPILPCMDNLISTAIVTSVHRIMVVFILIAELSIKLIISQRKAVHIMV
ncbi:hypothetical protein D3C75_1068670 [compost metagenome]